MTGSAAGLPGDLGPESENTDWCAAGDEHRPLRLQGVGDRVALAPLEERVDELDIAVDVEPGIDDQAAADLQVERLEEVVQARGLGVAEQGQDRAAAVRVGLELGDLLGLERVSGPDDAEQGEVVGDGVLEQVEVQGFATDGGQPGPPEADPRAAGVEVGRGGLAVPGGEGDLRFPFPPCRRMSAEVIASSPLKTDSNRSGPRRVTSGATGSNISEPGTTTNWASVPSPYSMRTPSPWTTARSGARLVRSSLRASSVYGFEAVDLDLAGAGRGVELEQLGDPLELADRSGAPAEEQVKSQGPVQALELVDGPGGEREGLLAGQVDSPAAVAEGRHVGDDQDAGEQGRVEEEAGKDRRPPEDRAGVPVRLDRHVQIKRQTDSDRQDRDRPEDALGEGQIAAHEDQGEPGRDPGDDPVAAPRGGASLSSSSGGDWPGGEPRRVQ